MPVGSNDIAVESAYISLAVGGNAEDQIPSATPIFLVVRVNAGTEAWSNGIAYRLHVILLDITQSYENVFNQVIAGHLNNAPPDPWLTQDYTFSFPLAPQGPIVSGPLDTIYRIEIVLTSGVSGQGLNVFESGLAVVTA